MGDQERITLDRDVMVEEALDIYYPLLIDHGASCAFPLSWFADTYKHTSMHTCIYAYKHTDIHTYTHICIQTYMHACIQT